MKVVEQPEVVEETHDHVHEEHAIVKQAVENYGGRFSKHRLGDDLATQTPFKMRVAKGRKRNKASKKGRKAARP